MSIQAQVAAVRMKTFGLLEEAMPGASVERVKKVFDAIPELAQLSIKLEMRGATVKEGSAIIQAYAAVTRLTKEELLIILDLLPKIVGLILEEQG